MDSDFQHQNYQHHFQDQRQFPHQRQQMNSLTRFRSAPSAYFASFLDAIDNTIPNSNEAGDAGNSGQRSDFSNARPLSPETENIFARFISSMVGDNNNSSSQKLCNIPENSMMEQTQFAVGSIKQETETLHQPQQQMIYQSQSKPPLARQSNSVSSVTSTTVMENSFQGGSSMGMDSAMPQMKIGGGNENNFNNNGSSTGLTRHSSSPAGFLSHIMNMDNGFGVMKGMGNFGGDDGQINFSSAPSTTSGLVNQNSDSDMGAKRFKSSGNNNNNSNSESNYMTGYPMTSWDDSILSENFSNLERSGGDDGRKTFSELDSSENQGQEGRNRPPLLSHHLSLPKTSAEISAMEQLLQFQDTVPCRIRAKRGCATHPRSIAERVRRTRISERMRKLQDLVPNMDKQTNTSDMLDLAVEYIKDLQNQVKSLTDNRAKCTCC